MKAKNNSQNIRENEGEKKETTNEELENTNRKREIQNKVLKRIVEHLNEQKEGITHKSSKK